MARTKPTVKTQRKKRSVKVAGRRRVGKSSTSRRMNIPRYLASGAKTLLGLIPGVGTALAGVADFVFKSLSITKQRLTTGQFKGETSIFGLGAFLEIPVAAIWQNSDLCQLDGTSTTLAPTYVSMFETVRLINVTFKVIPASKFGDRQGEWAMAFTPYMNPTDSADLLTQGITVPSYNTVCRRPGAVFGSASRPLQLSYSTTGNTYLEMHHPENVMIGYLMIAFQDTLRDNFSQFKASEIAPEVIISGRVQPGAMALTYNGLATKIRDVIKSINMSLVSYDGSRVGNLIDDGNYHHYADQPHHYCSGRISQVFANTIYGARPLQDASDEFEHLEV